MPPSTRNRLTTFRWLTTLLVGLGLVAGLALLPSYAQPATAPPTATPPLPPIEAHLPDSDFVIERFTTGSGERSQPSAIATASGSKAVLIVGPVGSSTQTYIDDAEKAAQVLEANGFQVERLYHPNATWDEVKAKMPGAQIVVYEGHGSLSYGFALTSDPDNANTCHVVSQQAITESITLAPRAVVILSHACYSAGQSSSDPTPVDSSEARERVQNYARTFLDIGAVAYFANNYYDAAEDYLDVMFDNLDQTMDYVFKNGGYYWYNGKPLLTFSYDYDPAYSLYLRQDADDDEWHRAFVGDAEATIRDSVQPPQMQLSPTSIAVLALATDDPTTRTIAVNNAGAGTFTWTATYTPTASGWFTATSLAGSAGQVITVTLDPWGRALGTYTGSVDVTAEEGTLDPQQSVSATLYVVEHIYYAYLPFVVRSATP
jgi:hypothetical protein